MRIYRLVTAGALGAATIGLVLPLVPTTPFLLLAAWSAARHSPELEARLLAHPRFGHHLILWRREGALSRRARCLAVTTLAVSGAFTVWLLESAAARWSVTAVLVAVAAYLLTRPFPRNPHHT